ncbi:dehydrogenase [Lithospermum erythrorhizon]|uniref:CASP-like protein n=1 Tax=Lithospermum erythrorhizon TaxID=34254 RepID=A0AAV3Q733_LITER
MDKAEATTVDIGESSKERKGKAPLLSTPPPPPIAKAKVAVGGYKKGVAIFNLILRISAVATSIGAVATMANAEETLPFFTQFFQFQASYDDLPTFTFFVVAMSFVLGYLILSIPFGIVCIARPYAKAPKMLLIISDTVMLVLATSTTAASTAMVYLAHNGNPNANWQAICNQFTDFCQQSSGAVVSAFITVALLIFMVVLSAIALKRT